ncbi:unnamed protein product [Coregonus sp. 'balchen']|nr:unnamed protein product [Coregonus sp. 'balchen']
MSSGLVCRLRAATRDAAEDEGGVRSLKLEQEVEKNNILSEELQTLATEHHELELSVVKGSSPRSALSEDEFYDAMSDLDSEHSLSVFEAVASHSFNKDEEKGLSCSTVSATSMSREDHHGNEESRPNGIVRHSTSLPASMFSRNDFSMWSILRKCIGIDLGFRLISDQVSHHPPVSAFHAEGLKKDFVFHGSIYPKLKFWGKSVEAEPKGIITLELPKYNEAYTWTNPTCCVHNIIVGQLWIEQYGNVEVFNHKTGERCCLNFKPCGLFGQELHKVEGYILDKSKKKVCSLYGKWTECMYIVDYAALEAHKRSGKGTAKKKSSKPVYLASEEKKRLEEKQRAACKTHSKSDDKWKTKWFQQGQNPHNGSQDWLFSTGYWNRNFPLLPDIY